MPKQQDLALQSDCMASQMIYCCLCSVKIDMSMVLFLTIWLDQMLGVSLFCSASGRNWPIILIVPAFRKSRKLLPQFRSDFMWLLRKKWCRDWKDDPDSSLEVIHGHHLQWEANGKAQRNGKELGQSKKEQEKMSKARKKIENRTQSFT